MMDDRPFTDAELARAQAARFLLPEPGPEVVGRFIATIAAKDAEIEQLRAEVLGCQSGAVEAMDRGSALRAGLVRDHAAAVERVRLEEREACATLCEQTPVCGCYDGVAQAPLGTICPECEQETGTDQLAFDIASRIRARSKET